MASFSDGQCLVVQLEAMPAPATFSAASIKVAFGPGPYTQLLLSVLALRTLSDSLFDGWDMAYACTIFLILAKFFEAFFSAVCLRTGIYFRKSLIRTVVPTGCGAR